ncbi:MAG: hypothetical protein O2904_04705 [bacterium]|nr:hypothetical protein [bacterium]
MLSPEEAAYDVLNKPYSLSDLTEDAAIAYVRDREMDPQGTKSRLLMELRAKMRNNAETLMLKYRQWEYILAGITLVSDRHSYREYPVTRMSDIVGYTKSLLPSEGDIDSSPRKSSLQKIDIQQPPRDATYDKCLSAAENYFSVLNADAEYWMSQLADMLRAGVLNRQIDPQLWKVTIEMCMHRLHTDDIYNVVQPMLNIAHMVNSATSEMDKIFAIPQDPRKKKR